MAKKIFGYNVDFNKNQTLKQRIEHLISAPTLTAGDSGYIYFNTADGYPYLWNGTVWYNLATSTSTVWRKSDGVTPADSYTEQIHHTGSVVLNGVAKDAAYNNAFGSTVIVGTLGIQGTTIQSENTTGWLNIAGNQGLRLYQVNQNVGYVQIGNDSLGTMVPQSGDYNTKISRAWTASAQNYDPNWTNIYSAGAVNYSAVTATDRTFTSLYIEPTLNNVTRHVGINTSGLIRFRNYNTDVTTETAVKGLGVGANGWVVTTALGGGGGGSHVVTGYVAIYEDTDEKYYQGYNVDGTPYIVRTDSEGTLENATGVTDLSTDWPNRLSLTYV